MATFKSHIRVTKHGEKTPHSSPVSLRLLLTCNGELPLQYFLQKSPPIFREQAVNQRTHHTKQRIVTGQTANQSNFYI